MFGNVREAFAQAMGCQGLDQPDAQLGDALAHGLDFFDPQALEVGVAKNLRHYRRAMVRWRRPQVARQQGQLAAHIHQLFGIMAAHQQGAGAVTIEAEVLRARAGNQQLGQFGGEQPYRPGVFFQAIAKALVGKVDQRQQLATAHHVQHGAPVILAQVETGRVMAAGVQQYHIACWRGFQGSEHPGDIQAVVRTDVGIVADLEAGAGEDGFVDRPGRVAQPDTAARQAVLDELRCQAQGTGTARGLGSAGALVAEQRRITAQDQFADQPAKGRIAMTADVALAGLLLKQALFGLLDRGRNRRQALGILEHADTEVELVRVAVLGICLHQPEDRIAGYAPDGAEVHYLRPSAVLATSSVRAAMMKSLRCRPLIEWLHQVTVTLPHSVSRPG
ncbi:hypothetical protein D3C78_671210 [compost metagenome]